VKFLPPPHESYLGCSPLVLVLLLFVGAVVGASLILGLQGLLP
jgi:hypothetical protein